MKAKLLKKARNSVSIVNVYGKPANNTDKKCMVVIKGMFGSTPVVCRTTKNNQYYINFGNAKIRKRVEILRIAKELSTKKRWWDVFSND